MYDPKEANKTYLNLLKDNGIIACIKSALLVTILYLFNRFVYQEDVSIPNSIGIYLFFCIYFSFKPKLIRLLRGYLRGEEYRNKSYH